MAITVIDIIKPKTSDFKVVDMADVDCAQDSLSSTQDLDFGIVMKDGTLQKISKDDIVNLIIDRATELGLLSRTINGLSTYSVVNWSTAWNFTKDQVTYTPVNIPHTCNQSDGLSKSMYRGKTWYTKELSVDNSANSKTFYLIFESAGQKSTLYVDNEEVTSYAGGYTPFIAQLPTLATGSHTITIMCDNTADIDLIPVSADFNFNNGLHKNVYLLTQSLIGFDAVTYGYDRFHVIPSVVSITDVNSLTATVSIKVKAKINNAHNKSLNGKVICTLTDKATGKNVFSDEITVILSATGNYDYMLENTIESITLWNGIKNPQLYTITLKLYVYDMLIDTVSTSIGFRKISLDEVNGFMLNDKAYPLRGTAVHQDYPNSMSAMSNTEFDVDYTIIRELGCTVVRLAHYPHSDYAFKKCDELGLIVQTEVPWVNHCGINATQTYYDCIKDNVTSMITNYFNHTSIVFWGLSNELNGTHWAGGGDPQGGYSYSKALEWNNLLYTHAKTLDSSRFVGFVAHPNTFNSTPSKSTEWSADWIGLNLYYGWYYGDFSGLSTTLDSYHTNRPFLSLTEYGAGANPDTHSEDPMSTTNTGTGGAIHDEEYQNLFHESHLEQIQSKPWLVFTSIWVLFDFAVSGRNEGGMPYMNDKGIVTRDRKTKKDSFFLYKAAWNSEPMVYITSRRFTSIRPDTIKIKVYANTDSVSLYREDGTTLVATMSAATKCGVVWEFENVKFTSSTSNETFIVKGVKNGVTVSDSVTFYHNIPQTNYVYHVDVDFIGSNDNLSVVDKMGRATVTLDGFSGTETSGFNADGYLDNTTGTGVVTLTNLNMNGLTGPIEIGMELDKFLFTTFNHRGRFMLMSDNILDCYIVCNEDAKKYFAIEHIADGDTDPTVGRSSQLSTQHTYSNITVVLKFDDVSQPCSSISYTRFNSSGIPEEVTLVELTDYNDISAKYPVSHFTRAANLCDTIYLLNRAAKDRPIKSAIKRFFIRTEDTTTVRHITAVYTASAPAIGDSLDISLVQVTLHNTDGTSEQVTDFTIAETDLVLKDGSNIFVINYDDLTCELNVVVSSLTITKQPVDITANACESVQFSVDVIGTDITYQWQYSSSGSTSWSDSAGETTNTLTVEALGVRNGRKYRCVVSNGDKTLTSNQATLTVVTPTSSSYYDFGRKIAYVPLAELNENSTILVTLEGFSYPSKETVAGTHMVSSKSPNNSAGSCGAVIQLNSVTYEAFYLAMNDTPSSQLSTTRYSKVFNASASLLSTKSLTILMSRETFKTNYDVVSDYPAISSPGVLQKNSGYLFINTGDGPDVVAHNPNYYATSQELTDAITNGEQYYNFNSLKISTLKVWKDTKYTSIPDALESTIQADIDIRVDNNGLPYNAGTSGDLVCSI